MSIFLRSYEFFNGLFFLLGAILRQLPTTGAGTRLKATIKDLGEYSQTATDASFKQRAVKVWRKKMKKNPATSENDSQNCGEYLTIQEVFFQN